MRTPRRPSISGLTAANSVVECIAGSIQLLDEPLSIWTKQAGGATEVVTSADVGIERELIRRLSEAFPGATYICEESTTPATGRRGGIVAVIDPIDGTREFVRGRPTFSICVALFEDGEPVAGVVHIPRRGRTFVGVAGSGATLNGAETGVAAFRPSSRVRIAVGPGDIDRPELAALGPYFGQVTISKVPTASIKQTAVACGDFDLAIALPNSGSSRFPMIWDYAASAIVVAASGGRVIDFTGADLLAGGTDKLEARCGWIAGSPVLVRAALEALLRTPSSLESQRS